MGRRANTTPIWLLLGLGVGLLSGCGFVSNSAPAPSLGTPISSNSSAPSTPPPVASTPTQVAPTAPAAAQTDYFRESVNRATSAVAIGQSAQSQDDWRLAASRWQQAVDLMQKVPSGSANYAQVQTKVKEYRQNLAAAQQRAEGKPVVTATAQPSQPNGLVAQIPIQERHGGTPVVNVTLKGQKGSHAFPMLFDTGATGTLITAAMAQEIGVVVVGETNVTIADGSVVTMPIGYVDAIEVGGLQKTSMLVAIGGSVGLLGQDVYGEYGIALGSHVINLHQ